MAQNSSVINVHQHMHTARLYVIDKLQPSYMFQQYIAILGEISLWRNI